MNTKSHNRLKVFLCHANEDKAAVRAIRQWLETLGIEAWLDEENLIPGQNWRTEVTKAVRASDIVLVCISRASSNKSGFVQKEIRLALDAADEKPDETIFIIPLKLEECEVPERLRSWQWVNLFADEGHERLLLTLQLRAKELGIALACGSPVLRDEAHLSLLRTKLRAKPKCVKYNNRSGRLISLSFCRDGLSRCR